MVCGCCGEKNRNATGCSCGGGKSHTCRRIGPTPVTQTNPVSKIASNEEVANSQAAPLLHNPVPKFDDIWSIAAINSDSSGRKAIVNTWEALSINMSHYVSIQNDGLKNPAILCITELASVKGARLFFERLNQNDNNLRYDHVIDKLSAGEHICVCWNENLWTKIDINGGTNSNAGYIVSAQGRYMAICLETKGANPIKLLLLAVHLPHKRGRESARYLLTTAIIELARINKVEAVAIVGDFNIQFHTNKHAFFPDFNALFFNRPTTEKGRRIDNVLVNQYLAPYMKNYARDIHYRCNLFSHYPIHVHRP